MALSGTSRVKNTWVDHVPQSRLTLEAGLVALPTRSRVKPGCRNEDACGRRGIGRSGDSCDRNGNLMFFHLVSTISDSGAGALALVCSCGFLVACHVV